MKRILSIFCGLAIFAGASTAHAQIEWAAGAPDGTPGGSIELVADANLFLATGISAAQVAPTTGADYTISAWINASEEGVDDLGLPTGIVDADPEFWWFGTGAQGLHLGLGAGQTTLFSGHWNNDSAGITPLQVNTWVHATHVYRDGVQEIYFNGVLESSLLVGAPNNDSMDLQIGSRSGDAGPNWAGRIDDVAIFTSALSAADILTLAGDTSQAVTLGAAAYYNFEDDQTGSTAANLVDVATSGLTGTDGSPALQELVGIGDPLPPPPPQATWTTGAPGGTSGGALNFDGSTHFADLGISADFIGGNRAGGSLGTDYTVSAWILSNLESDAFPGSAANDRWWLASARRGVHFGVFSGGSNDVPPAPGSLQDQMGSSLRQGHWGADTGGSSVVPVNEWVHVTYVYDADGGSVDPVSGLGTGLVTIYRGGVSEGSNDADAPDQSGTNLRLGTRANNNGVPRNSWSGSVDDVALFTSALDATQVASLASPTADPVGLGAVAYYNFEDDQTGSTAANLVDVATSGLTDSDGNPSPQVIDRIDPAPFEVCVLGDCNFNGTVDFLDISPFISILTGSDFVCEADCNQDGSVDFLDISPFITILASQ